MKTLLFFLLATLPCYARLGETIDQSIQRYGQPERSKETAPGCKMFIFHKASFLIWAAFYNGVCTELKITKVFLGPSGDNDYRQTPTITDEEVIAILDQNTDGFSWGRPVTADLGDGVKQTTWQRSDGASAKKFENSTQVEFAAKDDGYMAALGRDLIQKQQDEAKKETNGL